MKTANSKGLSPTLWRTCRVLSGPTRISLFRRIIQVPGQCVSELAKAEKISRPRASQELRRLQSRGLVRVERTGRYALYYPESDPLVSSAKPLLRAMKETCARLSAAEDARVVETAMGVSHGKRIDIVGVLRAGPLDNRGLQARLRMPVETLRHHLGFLENGGWIQRAGKAWELAENNHPLAKCLLQLI